MTMLFFDEARELEEYQIFRQQYQPLDLPYEKARVALREAEAGLREHSDDKTRETRVAELKARLAALEPRAPWLNLDSPVEYLLWGPPHG